MSTACMFDEHGACARSLALRCSFRALKLGVLGLECLDRRQGLLEGILSRHRACSHTSGALLPLLERFELVLLLFI